MQEVFSTCVLAVVGHASRKPCMKPPRKPQQATLHRGLSRKRTSVSVASTFDIASSAGTRVRRSAVGIFRGVPKDHSFSYWKAPIFLPASNSSLSLASPAKASPYAWTSGAMSGNLAAMSLSDGAPDEAPSIPSRVNSEPRFRSSEASFARSTWGASIVILTSLAPDGPSTIWCPFGVYPFRTSKAETRASAPLFSVPPIVIVTMIPGHEYATFFRFWIALIGLERETLRNKTYKALHGPRSTRSISQPFFGS